MSMVTFPLAEEGVDEMNLKRKLDAVPGTIRTRVLY